MDRILVLTVSEGKRLIAKGVAKMDVIKRCLKEGTIAIAKGSTNSYVVEEILGRHIDRYNYTTGLTIPEKKTPPERKELKDIVIKNGKVLDDITVIEAVKQMGEGDIFIKGCNALNYTKRQAGILIGHPEGGTIGATIGRIVAQKIDLLIPVGLEKLVYQDLNEISRRLSKTKNSLSLMPVPGKIFTEIEAIKTFADVQVELISSGGIFGAEGGIRLLISGTKEELKKVENLIEGVLGEPPFIT